MVVLKSKFFLKSPVSKWSFVNFELFKSQELTKYMITCYLVHTNFTIFTLVVKKCAIVTY